MSEKAKNIKVATPIDERETFVSLKSHFAESGISVEEKLKTLYALQQADNQLDKILNKRGELPQEVAALQEDVAALEAKITRNEEAIEGYTASIESNKERIIEIDAESAKYQEQLGNVANSREFDSISKEIENLGYEREIAEKHIGEARMAIAERKEAIAAISERIDIRKEDLAAKQEELANIVEATSKEEEVLLEKRNALAAKIDERTISAYDRIRGSVKNRLAVVAVYNENACGGCFSTITPQKLVDIASGTKLVICEHCGRILVNPDAE